MANKLRAHITLKKFHKDLGLTEIEISGCRPESHYKYVVEDDHKQFYIVDLEDPRWCNVPDAYEASLDGKFNAGVCDKHYNYSLRKYNALWAKSGYALYAKRGVHNHSRKFYTTIYEIIPLSIEDAIQYIL